jgi:hypothetical protein
MSYQIVQLNVSQTFAPAPITLQSSGAFISQGGTTLANGTSALLTQNSDLTPLLAAPLAITSLAWSSSVVLATTTAAIPGLSTGDTFITTVTGATPAAYNGLVLATVTGANTFTYALAANPGAETVPGTYTPPGQGELVSMVGTFFGQGTAQSAYVLELGPGDEANGTTALAAWIIANPGVYYSYLVPRIWDVSSGLLALIAAYEAPTAKVYFWVTTTLANWSTYTKLMKCVNARIEAPGIPLTEFSQAVAFQKSLSYAPSSGNRMTPLAFSYYNGVTPYPTRGNNALLTTLQNANINVIGTGAEGGSSTALDWWGKMLDGNDFSYWYSVDWYQLAAAQALAADVQNGSNSSLNPLTYDQHGIDTLQDSLIQVNNDAITFNLANGTVARAALDGPAFQQALDSGAYVDQDVVNAVPFKIYVAENPSDFQAETYKGLSSVYIPQRGFMKIVFNLNVSSFLGI